jgi:hypothetical protein
MKKGEGLSSEDAANEGGGFYTQPSSFLLGDLM